MKALIASIISLIFLIFAILEAVDYLSLNIKLMQDIQPAFKGDCANATENIAETLTEYTIDYAQCLPTIAIIGLIMGAVLGALGIKRK